MKNRLCLALALSVAAAAAAFAQDAKETEVQKDGKEKETIFSGRLFAAAIENEKSYACFVRSYTATHLAGHPLQKVKAMKMLVTAEPDEDKRIGYSFRLGVRFTQRPGDFDSSGVCSFGIQEGKGKSELTCGVDCDGGGISIELTKDFKSTLVRLERIRIWQNSKPDDEGLDLSGGADDRIFRLDRAKLDQCKSLIVDRKELAAIRTLKK